MIEGYWDESFARARNAALAEARGDWVLSLDADETLLADPTSLRTLLTDRRSEVEAYLVAIENLHGAGTRVRSTRRSVSFAGGPAPGATASTSRWWRRTTRADA